MDGGAGADALKGGAGDDSMVLTTLQLLAGPTSLHRLNVSGDAGDAVMSSGQGSTLAVRGAAFDGILFDTYEVAGSNAQLWIEQELVATSLLS